MKSYYLAYEITTPSGSKFCTGKRYAECLAAYHCGEVLPHRTSVEFGYLERNIGTAEDPMVLEN
jgi:hypothetical protein